MNSDRRKQLKDFEEILGIKFDKMYLLDAALTHSSYAHQHNLTYNDHNERLEFLGDSVLSMVVSEYLFKKFKSKHEGKLSRIRAGVVCEASLAEVSRKLNVSYFIKIGKGEELSGGREKDSLLADACEAIIAAIYLDKGLEVVREFILGNLVEKIDRIGKDHNYNDYKSKLQEYVQKYSTSPIKYTVINETGPAHDKTFEVEISIEGKRYGSGAGKSKKEAEQNAAKVALDNIGDEANG